MGIAMSLRDGSLNLSNSWTRQLSETATGVVRFFDLSYFSFLAHSTFLFFLLFIVVGQNYVADL